MVIMADGNSTGGLNIPGSARRKKAYSVSLHENNFDISEVPCLQEEVVSLEGDESVLPVADSKCHSCGQILPLRAFKENDVDQSRTLVSSDSPLHLHSNRISPPAERQPVATSRLAYLP